MRCDFKISEFQISNCRDAPRASFFVDLQIWLFVDLFSTPPEKLSFFSSPYKGDRFALLLVFYISPFQGEYLPNGRGRVRK